MVFSNLSSNEKDAFFGLLDEYFSSRPDLLGSVGTGPSEGAADSTAHGAAASAVHRALASNPEATSKLVSAGLKHGVPKNSPYAAAASNPEVNNAVGRVAAASLAFGARNNNSNSISPPPAPPHRTSSATSTSSEDQRSPSIADKPKLVTARKFGDVDTSSAKNMFGSLRNSTANKSYSPPPPIVPSAFPAKKNTFAPPPTRRGPSEASVASTAPPPAPPPRRQEPAEEEQEQGEWAEALYDYDSTDSGDLQIRANQRVLVTERTSEDWWTGEFDGKKGLFPASYVQIL